MGLQPLLKQFTSFDDRLRGVLPTRMVEGYRMLISHGENRFEAFDDVVRRLVLGPRRRLSSEFATADRRDDGPGIRRQPAKIASEVT